MKEIEEYYENFKKIDFDYDSINELCKYPFDSKLWLKYFNLFTQKNNVNRNGLYNLRIYIMSDTQKTFKELRYYLKDKKQIISQEDLNYSIKNTKSYQNNFDYDINKNLNYSTKILIYENDCIDVGLFFKKKGFNPVVLNMVITIYFY
jgi:hypothetical protein